MVSLHVPVVTLRRCLALDQYYLCRTHPAHRTLTRIEVNLVNCRSIYHFLAIADANRKKRLGKDGKTQRRGMGWNKPAVHIYGGSSYGANLTPQEARDWLAGLLEKLEIGTAITAAHFGDKHGRFDFHLLVPFYDPAGRPLKPARKSLRGHVRACACAMTDALNTKRLEAGNHLTIGNLDSAGTLFFMEKEPEKTIGEPGPVEEPTQPAPPVDEPPVAAVVAPQIKAEPAPVAKEGEIAGNRLIVSSPGITTGGQAGSGAPKTAVPSGQDSSNFESAGSVRPAVPDATTSSTPPANKPILTPAPVAADSPAEIVPVTALAKDGLGKSIGHGEAGSPAPKEKTPAGAGPAMRREGAPPAADPTKESSDDDDEKRKLEQAARIRAQQLREVAMLWKLARDGEAQVARDREAAELAAKEKSAADALARRTAPLFERLVTVIHQLEMTPQSEKLQKNFCELCEALHTQYGEALPPQENWDYSAMLERTVKLAAGKTGANEFIATAEEHISLLKEKSVDHGMDKNS